MLPAKHILPSLFSTLLLGLAGSAVAGSGAPFVFGSSSAYSLLTYSLADTQLESRVCRAAGQSLRQVGVETINKTSLVITTVYLPLPDRSGRILDLNALQYDDLLPAHFVISDGALGSAFIEVDSRPGSALSRQLDRMASEVRRRAAGGDVFEVLRTYAGSVMRIEPNGWHPGICAAADASPLSPPPEFAQARDLAVGHFPLTTDLWQPTMKLEDFYLLGHGNCVPKSLTTRLILQRLGFAARIRAGGASSFGHMWVELPDGRHLDPTWELLESPTTDGALPGWFHISNSDLFADQVYPIAVD